MGLKDKAMMAAEVLAPEAAPAIEAKKAVDMKKEQDKKAIDKSRLEIEKEKQIAKNVEEAKKEEKSQARKDKLQNVWRKISSSGSGRNSNIGVFFILTFMLHLFDGLMNNFSRLPGNFMMILGLYVALTLFAIFIIYKSSLSSETWTIVGISLFAFFLPFIMNFYYTDYLFAILLAVPVWPLYLFFNPSDSTAIEKIGRWYFFVVIGLAVYIFLTNIAVGQVLSSPGGDARAGTEILHEFFVVNTGKVFDSIMNIPTNIMDRVDQTINMPYFTGQVEKNKDVPLGVYIEDLKTTEPVFNAGRPIVVWATLRGKSFQGAIKVTNRCYALKGKEVFSGVVYPEDYELYYEDSIPLECRFNEGLPAGIYKAMFASSFLFPTWGYVTYTFIDRETLRSYYSQGKNVNNALDIPKKAEATYTSGPAGIGMSSIDLPIAIDMADVEGTFQDSVKIPSFGVTLSNSWSHGKIDYVNKLIVTIPEDISLTNCIPKVSSIDSEEGTDSYLFTVSSPGEFFTTVTCQTEIINPSEFIGSNLKVDRTIAVESEYSYSLKEDITIRVEE